MRRLWAYLDDDGTGGNGGGEGEREDKSKGGGAGEGEGEKTGAELERARRESADLRKRLKAAETKAADLESAGLSERERAERERDEAKKTAEGATGRLRASSLRAEIGLQAGGLGIVNAKMAAKLIDDEAVEYDAGEATPASVAKALRAAVKEYPSLARAGSADEGAGGGPGPGGVGGDSFAKGFNAAVKRARR